MVLYHGSCDLVEHPEIRTSGTFLDFGNGFYTTTSYEQAERWARIKMRRLNRSVGYVSIYAFDDDAAMQELHIERFDQADKDWLTFVVQNRRGESVKTDIDLHIGPVADDNVYRSIRLFETGVLDAEETLKRLKTELLHDQWTFHSERSLAYLKFVEAKEITEEVPV